MKTVLAILLFLMAASCDARVALTQDTVFYVAPPPGQGPVAGNDANDCLSPATPCLTMQHVYETLRTNYDLASHSVTVQLMAGTHHAGLNAFGPLLGQTALSSLVFRGNASNPETVLVAPDVSNAFAAAYGANFRVRDLAIDTTTANQDNIAVGQGGIVAINNLVFKNAGASSASGMNHVSVASSGFLLVEGPYTIKGGGQCHMSAGFGGTIYYNTNGDPAFAFNVTVLGMPTFGAAFMCAVAGFINVAAVRFNGGANGPTYLVKENGVISTENGNPNYFPGMIGGTATTGGQYN